MTRKEDLPAAEEILARVIESFGRRVVVESPTGERQDAELFGKRLAVVCGDRVRLRRAPGADVLQVVEALPRNTTFSRTDSRGRLELLAANLSLLIAIIAPEPAPDPFILDRYLAGAAYSGLQPAIVANKCDLLARKDVLPSALAEYRAAGYPVLEVSTTTGDGKEALEALLRGHTAIFTGQSGVGKSSLTNLLLGGSSRSIGNLSSSTGEGRHTTVSTALFRLPGGGEIIDCPGVRDYAPAPVSDAMVQHGWPEIRALATECRFNNCLHLREPGCAVINAVESEVMSARRYESYKRLVNSMRQLLPSYERPR
jgi:ribosome biogenesis GTPase